MECCGVLRRRYEDMERGGGGRKFNDVLAYAGGDVRWCVVMQV